MDSLTDTTARLIVENPRFKSLVSARARMRWGLSTIVIVAFLGFVLMNCFARSLLATRPGDGPATLALYAVVCMFVFAVAVTGIYVQRAGSLFGPMNDELLREIAP